MKYIKNFDQFVNENYLSHDHSPKSVGGHFTIDEDDNLRISVENDPEMWEAIKQSNENNDEAFLWDFFESELTNGYCLVHPSNKSLTEAPMISTDLDLQVDDADLEEKEDSLAYEMGAEDTQTWFYNEYMIRSVRQELAEYGYVIFTHV